MIPLSIVAFGLAGVAVGGVKNIVVVLAGIAISGLMWTWILATMNTVFQMLTPDWVRGRTMAAFVLAVFGILPIGALSAGALADLVGAGVALLIFSMAVALVGGIGLRMELPVLEEIVSPIMIPEHPRAALHPTRLEGPLMAVNTWTIESPGEMDDFGSVLAELRRLRLATGAYRWNAYRAYDDPTQVSETYVVHSWEHHVQLQNRLDTRGKETIERAERFGSSQRHVTTHLVEFDVTSNEVRRQKR